MLSLTPAKPVKVSEIYLSKEQINAQTPGNLLHTFFTSVRPPKKVLEDQLTQILRKYGAPKPNKNKYSKAGKEQHQGKVMSTKRPISKPPTKEKSVLNSVRTALSEKKAVLKSKSPEKPRSDEKDLEKSPPKKAEGWSSPDAPTSGDLLWSCAGVGRSLAVSWENKDVYARAVRSLRLRELQNPECMTAVRAGLSSIIPLQLLTMLTPLEMELRTCGLPHINLEFLKAHTMYQVGLMETDQHIEFFWTALEMFTQEELCRFIKFACNQERIPFTCPCKDGGPDTAHVPPYPMKIAPPDGAAGQPDSRYIRVETCMFMVKLPQYSSLDVMLEKLRYAVHYREDPLSG
eukprot:XP_011619682.1 PREDICTED: probable E3 ubiquitin-protein ligase HECTD4 [Takifugu rubripes]